MDPLQETVLYAFYPDRILTIEQVAYRSKRMLPFVRNTINRDFVKDGLVEEAFVNQPGEHFKLTIKGYNEVVRINNKRARIAARIAELRASGVRAAQAAMIAATEAIESDISAS